VTTAHKRDRRGRIVTGAATLAFLVLGVGIWVANDDDGNVQPVKPPSDPVSTDQVALPDGVLRLPESNGPDGILITRPGRYQVPLGDTGFFEIELPVDASVNGDGLYIAFDAIILKTEIADETYGLPRDPCTAFNDLEAVGPSVENLVSAIRNEPVYRVSRPEPVEIDGAAGQYLELRIPATYDASTCTDSQLGLPGNPGSNNNMEPGYVGRWWILDVAGQRTVMQAFCVECEADTTERVTAMVQGITFRSSP
jgi:hypothetical protein